MIVATLRGSRFPIETALLAALAFFLPLLEAPKNIVWLAWVLTWLFNRVRSRDFGARGGGLLAHSAVALFHHPSRRTRSCTPLSFVI